MGVCASPASMHSMTFKQDLTGLGGQCRLKFPHEDAQFRGSRAAEDRSCCTINGMKGLVLVSRSFKIFHLEVGVCNEFQSAVE